MSNFSYLFSMGFFAGVIVTLMFSSVVYSLDMREMKAKAVELQAAEWVVDPQTGETEFQWKGGDQ